MTKDVIREICRIYAGDYRTVRDKWERALEAAAIRKQKEQDDLIKIINDTADAKDSNDSRDRYHDVYAKYGADSKDYDNDAKGGGGGGGGGRSNKDAKREKEVDILILTGEEEDLGVDMQQLCEDISSGKGIWRVYQY